MLNAVIEHLDIPNSWTALTVALNEPTGTCVLLFPADQQPQLAFWQQQLEHIHATEMVSLYSQLEALVNQLNATQLSPKLAVIALFGDKVILISLEAGIDVERAGQRKVALAPAESLAAVEGVFHPQSTYYLADAAKVQFNDLTISAHPGAVTKKMVGLANLTGIKKFLSKAPRKFGQFTGNLGQAIRTLPSSIKIKFGLGCGAVIIIVVAAFVLRSLSQAQTQQKVVQLSQPIEQQVQEAQVLATTNPTATRKKLEEAAAKYEQLSKDEQLSSEVKKGLLLKQRQVLQLLEQIKAASTVASLPTFFDMRLVQSDFLASRLTLAGQTIVLLDPQPRKIIALDTINKNARLLPAGALDTISDLTASPNAIYYAGSGVFQAELGNDTIPSAISPAASSSADFIRYYNQNVYLLSKQHRSISRLSLEKTNQKELPSPQNWLKAGQILDFDAVSDMAVDGDVWIATRTGQILKFSSGTQQEFQVQGLEPVPNSALAIYTSEDLTNLYVLEPQQSRLLILDKKGSLIKEIHSDTFISTTGLVVDEQQKKAFVLSGSQLFEVSLP